MTTATRSPLLLWIERGLLALGIGLGVWCAGLVIESTFFNHLAINDPDAGGIVVTQTLAPGARALPGDAHDAAASRPAAPSPAQGSLLGRLEAPSVAMSATVLEGSDDGTLSRGAGHIEDTPLPGAAGNVGIAGHRDTVFRPLRKIHVGDPLTLRTRDRIYHYRIDRTLIVGPDDVAVLDPTPTPTLTLVTCYPFEFVGHAPRRFIVQATLVGEAAAGTN
jgi:sortase A